MADSVIRRWGLWSVVAALALSSVRVVAATPEPRELDEIVRGAVFPGFRGAAVLVHRGEVVWSEGYGALSPESRARVTERTLFDVGSVAKPITALAVLRLVDSGALGLGTTIGEVFGEEFAGSASGVTIGAVLRHRGGLPPAMRITGDPEDLDAALRGVFARHSPAFEGRYSYSNAGYTVLAAVIAEVSGEPFEAFVGREVFDAAGMGDTVFVGGEPDAPTAARVFSGVDGRGAVEANAARFAWGWGFRGATGVLTSARDLAALEGALASDDLLAAESRALFLGLDGDDPPTWTFEPDGEGGFVLSHGGATRGFFAELVYWPGRRSMAAVLSGHRPAPRGLARRLLEAVEPDLERRARLILRTGSLELNDFGAFVTEEHGEVSASSVEGSGVELSVRDASIDRELAALRLSRQAALALADGLDRAADASEGEPSPGVFAGLYTARQRIGDDGTVRLEPGGLRVEAVAGYRGKGRGDPRPTIRVVDEARGTWPLIVRFGSDRAVALAEAIRAALHKAHE